MASASSRGWGPPGSGRIVQVRAPNGVAFPGGVRAEIAHLVEGMLREFQERGYHAKEGWCWGYAYRKIRGSSTAWSNHAWGLAIDFNAPDHPLGARGTGVPEWAPEVAARWGFFWGGRYSGRADEMHYEFLGTPGDVASYPMGGPTKGSWLMNDAEAEQLLRGIDDVVRGAYNHATQARDEARHLRGEVATLQGHVLHQGEEQDKMRRDIRVFAEAAGIKVES